MTNITTIKVLTSELKLGMYVSKLDRPWLGTPFLFQGFPITKPEEIDKLQEHCEFVYVDKMLSHTDVEPSDRRPFPRTVGRRINGSAVDTNGLLNKAWSFGKRLFRAGPGGALGATSHTGPMGHTYQDQVGVAQELSVARTTYSKAQNIIHEVMTGLRTGGRLDIEVVQTVVAPMVDSVLRNNDAIAWLARMQSKDDYTYNHSLATSVYTIVLGRHLGYSRNELHLLGLGGLLLDVGKTRLSDDLLKKTQTLTDAELEEVRRHVQYSVEILEETPGIHASVLEMVHTHHERYNGTGYPAGLDGDDIPMFGQIGGLCDSFDAMTTERPYADALSAYEAMRKLLALAGVEYKAELVEQFIQCVGMFPTGTLVELSTGEVGVVISQNKLRRLRPKVMLILDAKKKPLEHFKTIDLRKEPEDGSDKDSIWIRWGLEPGAYGIDPADYYL